MAKHNHLPSSLRLCAKAARRLPLLLILAMPLAGLAQYTYTTNADNTITITGYTGTDAVLDIPILIESRQVTVIGYGAFSYNSSLTAVTIPSSVTNIGYSSDSGAFWFCPNLTNITIATANSFYSSADGVLIDKVNNRLIQCPEGKVDSVTVPDGITIIGDYAFNSCSSLTGITIPATITNIGYGVFWYCSALTAITVAAANSFYSSADGVLIDKVNNRLIQCPEGKAGSVTVPDSVTIIGAWSFSDCAKLTSVTASASVTNIETSAFDSSGLTTLYFQGDAPSLGADVFASVTVTVYYLAGRAGWSSPFGGLTAVLWNPQVQDLGMQSNRFGFNITGTNDFIVVVEARTNLTGGIWVPVKTNMLTGGSVQFSDPQTTNYSRRFYRIAMPQ